MDMTDKLIMNELGQPGGVRLSMTVDVEGLLENLQAIDETLWSRQGRVKSTHGHVDSIFLRGYAPIEGAKPVRDRDILHKLPRVKRLLHDELPGVPARAVLANLKPAGTVRLHTDKEEVFRGIVRMHVPLRTNNSVLCFFDEAFYDMRPGEVWAVNNLRSHAVANNGSAARLHLITDRIVSEEVITALQSGDPSLGYEDGEKRKLILNLSDQMQQETKHWRWAERVTSRVNRLLHGNAAKSHVSK